MKAVVYSSTPLGKKVDIPAFNASAFPCHDQDIDTVFLNGNFPEIEAICKSEKLTCKPFSEYQKPTKNKSSDANSLTTKE